MRFPLAVLLVLSMVSKALSLPILQRHITISAEISAVRRGQTPDPFDWRPYVPGAKPRQPEVPAEQPSQPNPGVGRPLKPPDPIPQAPSKQPSQPNPGTVPPNPPLDPIPPGGNALPELPIPPVFRWMFEGGRVSNPDPSSQDESNPLGVVFTASSGGDTTTTTESDEGDAGDTITTTGGDT